MLLVGEGVIETMPGTVPAFVTVGLRYLKLPSLAVTQHSRIAGPMGLPTAAPG